MSEDQSSPQSSEGKVTDLNKARQRRTEQGDGDDRDQKDERERQRRQRDRIVRYLNKDHAVVDHHGAVGIFRRVGNKLRPGFRNIYQLTERDFLLYWKNKPLTVIEPAPTASNPHAVKPYTLSWAQWWLKDPNRLTYDQVGFLPGVEDPPPGFFNTWQGWAVKPIKPRGSVGWPRMKEHIWRVTSSRNDDCYEYMMNWFARMVQEPNDVCHVAPVLHGGHGIGKGILGLYVLAMFGGHGLHLRDINQLLGRYNIHLQDCIYLFADELIWTGDKHLEGILRGLITERRLPVEEKYKNLYETLNCVHPMFSSNNDKVIPVATDDRRFLFLEVPDTHKGDTEYWVKLDAELRGHGPAAMLGELLWDRNITFFDPRQYPDTAAGRRQKRLSLKSVRQFIMAVLERGYVYQPEHRVPSLLRWRPFVTRELWWNGYMQWCEQSRSTYRQSREELYDALEKLFRPGRPREWHPTHELRRAEPGGRRQEPDPRQDALTCNDTGEPLIDADCLPDDPSGAIVCQWHMRGFYHPDLAEAQDRFDTVWGPIDSPWAHDRH